MVYAWMDSPGAHRTERVEIFDKKWKFFGMRQDFEAEIAEICHIEPDVFSRSHDIHKDSVAQRMAWASNRETTRPEDEAYCLMGLFGISMPPLYGEGRGAFLRLQEEIVRRLDDPSIFAWGEVFDQRDVNIILSEAGPDKSNFSLDRLFARSPSDYHYGHHMRRREKYKPAGYAIAGYKLVSAHIRVILRERSADCQRRSSESSSNTGALIC